MRLCQKIIEFDEKTLDKDVVKTTSQAAVSDVLKDDLVEALSDKEEGNEVVEDCLRIPWGRDYS